MNEEYILPLSDTLADCPSSWKGFINMLSDLDEQTDLDGFTVDVINKYLKKYGGEWVDSKHSTVLKFKSMEHLVVFKLRFGG